MSWITFREFEVKKATRPITTLKVVRKDNRSIYRNFVYEKAQEDNDKQTVKVKLRFDINYCNIEACTGYHSYHHNVIIHNNRIYSHNLMSMYEKIEDDMKLIICEIPVGTKYAVNEFGEYISETLIYRSDY